MDGEILSAIFMYLGKSAFTATLGAVGNKSRILKCFAAGVECVKSDDRASQIVDGTVV